MVGAPAPLDIPVLDRVERGVALLDAHGPARWWSRVDLRKLNVASFDRCVLGQVYGRYGNGACYDLVSRGDVDPGWVAWSCGFQRSPRDIAQGTCGEALYRELTAAWRGAIREIKRVRGR